ncbi:hypothetical protein OFM83_23345, partial [Escherichia coli]|nr:hypothetical protein [Escherichia coli]MCV5590235.1 hypothetical protein [Escherichia coli]
RNRSHWSTSKTPSYTKSVSWQHHPLPAVRRAYGRIQRIASRVIGAVIGMFALRLIYEGMTHR